MTIEQMAQRLNIGDDELEVLKAWEQAKTLPMRYLHLRDYLGARILDQQNIEWAEMIRMISNVRRDTPYTPEAMDELHIKLQRLVAALE